MPWIYVWTSEIKNIYVWTTPVKEVYLWDTKIRPTAVNTPWIYHNATLWLISMSSDGTTRITIADKNLWATTVYNNWDALSEANCGKFYQWGNNYWFNYNSSITVNQTKVNVSSYWPNNYYSSSTVYVASSFRDFYGTTNNFDMWGGETWTYEAMQWPCSTWYHIPSNEELKNLFKIFADLKWISSLFTETSYWYYAPYVSSWYYNNIYADFKTLLKIPQAWQYNAYAGSWGGSITLVYGSYIYYNTYNYPSVLVASWNNFWANPGDTGYHFWILRPIRPFKNEAVQPDDSRTKLN